MKILWLSSLVAGFATAAMCMAQHFGPSLADRRDYYMPSYAVAVGDVNGDRIPDLVSGVASMSVLLGNGDGTFKTGPVTPEPYGVNGLVLRDMNGDGKLDAIFATYAQGPGSGVAICLGNGDGTFQQPTLYAIGSDENISSIVVGDFNGDHLLDVATLGVRGVWLFFGTAGGGLSSPTLVGLSWTYLSAGAFSAADLNGDGTLDLVAGVGSGPGVSVLLGIGDGTFRSPHFYSIPGGVFGLALSDLNNDGVIDLASTTVNSQHVSIMMGKGDGTFQDPTNTYLPGGVSIAAGDLNGDGIPDLVTQDAFVAFGKGDGTFQGPIFYPVGASAGTAGLTGTQVVLAELRTPGPLDIVTVNSAYGTLSVLLNNARGKFRDGQYLKVSGKPQCGAVADFDGNRTPDLAFGNGTGATVLMGTGQPNPAYSLPGTQINVPGGYCVATGDFNRDGLTDLAVIATTGPTTGTVAIYLGRGDGTFTAGANISVNVVPGVPVVADFNGDGSMDIALSGNLLLFGNGDGSFQTPRPFVPKTGLSASFVGLAAGDLNGDGFPDIVMVDGVHGLVYKLLNRGDGTFYQSTFTPPSPVGSPGCGFPEVPRLRDLNGDSKLDLALLCESDAVVTYLGKGDGAFESPTIIPGLWTTAFTYDLLVTDLNGDGKPDLAVLADHSVFVFTGNGDGTFNTPILFGAGPSPSTLAASHLHHTTNTSGRPDISITDASGSVVVLLNVTP